MIENKMLQSFYFHLSSTQTLFNPLLIESFVFLLFTHFENNSVDMIFLYMIDLPLNACKFLHKLIQSLVYDSIRHPLYVSRYDKSITNFFISFIT